MLQKDNTVTIKDGGVVMPKKYKGVVIVHPCYGLFLGFDHNYEYWSYFDSGKQPCAYVFLTKAAAKMTILRLSSDNNPDIYQYVTIRTRYEGYAYPDELCKVGLQLEAKQLFVNILEWISPSRELH